MNTSESIAKFRNYLSRDRYVGARFAFVGFERDGELHNLASRITWHPVRRPAPAIRTTGQGLVVASGWLTWREALRLLDTITEGQATIGDDVLAFRNTERNEPYGFSWEHSEIMWSWPYTDWSAHFLSLTGLQMGGVLGNTRLGWLGDRLISLRPDRIMSWRDVERIIGPQTVISESRNCGIELFAPIWAKLGEPWTIKVHSALMVPIESYVDPVRAKMELVAQEAANGALIAVVPASKWKRGRARTWTVCMDCESLRGSIDLSLNARDLKIWRSTIALPDLAARLLDGIDGGLGWLERMLLPKGPKMDSDGFERAVVSLLALGGIPTIPLGHDGPDRAVDLICAVSADHVLVGECTLGPIAPKKVGDIRHRAEGVLSRLRRPGEVLGTVASVFTPAAESDLPPEHLAIAAETGVVVIARERLTQLLSLAVSGELRFEFWNLVESWRPRPVIPVPTLRRRGLR